MDRAIPSGREKLLWVLGLTLFCSAGFLGVAKINILWVANGARTVTLETPLDGMIPFRPGWIWIYLSYYPFCFLPLAAWRRGVLFRQAAAGFGIQFATCLPFFALLPAWMDQPAVSGTSLSERAVRALYSVDPGFNIFPSLHVANVLLVAAVCWRLERRFGAAVWAWALLVAVSTVTVKQHYVVDVVAGAALAAGTIALVLVRWDGLWPDERLRSLGGASLKDPVDSPARSPEEAS